MKKKQQQQVYTWHDALVALQRPLATIYWPYTAWVAVICLFVVAVIFDLYLLASVIPALVLVALHLELSSNSGRYTSSTLVWLIIFFATIVGNIGFGFIN